MFEEAYRAEPAIAKASGLSLGSELFIISPFRGFQNQSGHFKAVSTTQQQVI